MRPMEELGHILPARKWSSRLSVRVAAAAVVVALFVLFPTLAGSYTTQLLGVAFLYAILSIGLDLAWGYTGILNMGQAVFFGTGALSVALFVTQVSSTGMVSRVTHDPVVYLAGLVAGIIAAMLIALILGLLAFWAKGTTQLYIAVVSLSFTLIASTGFIQARSFTGGDNGLSGFALIEIDGEIWYLIAGLALVAVAAVAHVVIRSDFGLLMRAVRDNEQRCLHLGFSVPRVKLGVLMAGSAIAALAGGIYACYVGFVSAPLFDFMFSTNIIIWTAVGGRGTLWGPAVGAILINLIGPRLSAQWPFIWTLFLGLLFIAVVTLIPDGLFPAAHKLIGVVRRPGRNSNALVSQANFSSQERTIVAASMSEAHDDSHNGVALGIEGLCRNFGSLEVLRGVSLEARARELLCIIGPNGAGKSTLLGVLSDGTQPHQGRVKTECAGDLRGLAPERLVCQGIARKFQTPNLFDTLTVAETLLLANQRGQVPSLWKRSTKVVVTPEVYEICRVTGLLERANEPARDLPHGMKQGLELAATVALRPEILLLDEPTAGLTSEERRTIGAVLRQIIDKRSITIILIEHDLEFVQSIADRVAVLHDGRVLLVGTPQEVSDSELVKNAYVGRR